MLETQQAELQSKGEITLRVKVHSNARLTRVKSVLADGVVKIDLQAVPEDGKANDALLDFLATTFAVKAENVQILLGKFSADKTVKIVK